MSIKQHGLCKLTDTQLTMIIGFAGTFSTMLGGIATQFFLLKKQSLDIQKQAQDNAAELRRKTEATARFLALKTEATAKVLAEKTDRNAQSIQEAHDSLLAAQNENTRLTMVGNDIKEDILKNQEAIAGTQKDLSDLKGHMNGST